jgi:protein transport protein SEC13
MVWKEVKQNSWEKVKEFDIHKSSVNCISWAPWQYGLILVAGSSDGQISILTHAQDKWNTEAFPAHKSGITSVSWGPAKCSTGDTSKEEESKETISQMQFISGGCDGLLKLWTFSKETNKFADETVANYSGWIKDATFAQFNTSGLALPKEYYAETELASTIAVCAEDKVLSILRLKQEKWVEYKLKDQPSQPVKLSWSANGHLLAVAYADGKSAVYQEQTEGNWEIMSTFSEEQISSQNDSSKEEKQS